VVPSGAVTPESIVKLIVEIIEPYQGRIYDPACGSGGMFVWSADFVKAHQQNPLNLSIYGQERVLETVRLAMMNLAMHGLPASGIVQANSYYDDVHHSAGHFDYVMANPPFNVNGVDKSRIKDDRRRFPFGMPSTDNANYLWIQLFYSALNDRGRAGFVMANSASDAHHSELEIRRQLIEAGAVDVMVAVGSNFFYTVTPPCTLWFLDRGKRGTEREDTVLFIDARSIFTQIDRAHRQFAAAQLEYTGLTHVKVVHRPRLLSDNGPAFVSKPLAQYLKSYRMKHVRGRAHHPQTQGKIERYHRSMKSIVKLDTYFYPWEMEQAIADFGVYYNTQRYHESLDNVTPADVFFGRDQEVLSKRAIIKQQTLQQRLQHHLHMTVQAF